MPLHRPATLMPTVTAHPARTLVSDLAAFTGGRAAAEHLLANATPGELVTATLDELERWLPKPKARRLHKLLRFARAALVPERPTRIEDHRAVHYLLYGDLIGLEAERFWAIPVDAACQPLAVVCIAGGTPTSVEVRPADIFSVAVRHRATGLVCAHNHPSGSLTASAEDVLLTERLVMAGMLLGIQVLDHVIVTTSGSASIREEFDRRGKPWKPDAGDEASHAAVARLAYDVPRIQMTDRQRDQLLGHLQLLLDRIRHLRDEAGRLPANEKEVPQLLFAIEEYDLLDDPTVLEAYSYLRGMAAGMGLPDVADLSAYARDRLTALPEPPNWASLVKAAGHAAELLAHSNDPTASEASRVLTTNLGEWRDAPWLDESERRLARQRRA